MGLRSELCNSQSTCENHVSCYLNHNFHFVIIEYTRAIMQKKNPVVKKPCHSVYSGRQLTLFIWTHNIAEPRPDQLKQP